MSRVVPLTSIFQTEDEIAGAVRAYIDTRLTWYD